MNPTSTTLHSWLDAVRDLRVLVVGDTMLDRYIWGDAFRISPEAPVPVVKVDHETVSAGGAANVALNVRALGAQATLCGCVGNDTNGHALLKALERHGVPLAPGCVLDDVDTIVKTRIVCRHQQLCRLDQEPPAARFAQESAALARRIEPLIAEADAVILSDYAKGLLTTELIAAVQSQAPAGRLVAMDPKPRSSIAYRGLGLMTPNRAEALQLAGIEDDGRNLPAEAVCKAIHERHHPERLVLTLGGDGMLLSEGGRVLERIPTAAREVFDVSGAGDTVIAAMSLALAAGLSLPEAARFANIAAGVVVGKLGTATAKPAEMLAAVEGVS